VKAMDNSNVVFGSVVEGMDVVKKVCVIIIKHHGLVLHSHVLA
jgi:cyclophilin family peptidyl-prolyl cis-trans isomerase